MKKELKQITFEFAGVEKKANISTAIKSINKEKEPVMEITKTMAKPVSTRGRKSLKDIGINADLVQIPEDDILFKKQYYSIGEVAVMFRENQSLIRYWKQSLIFCNP